MISVDDERCFVCGVRRRRRKSIVISGCGDDGGDGGYGSGHTGIHITPQILSGL